MAGRRLVAFVVGALLALAGFGLAGEPNSGAFIYDAPAIADLDASSVEVSANASAMVDRSGDRSAFRFVVGQGTSTTSARSFIATDGGSTLFRGTTEGYPGSPGLQRAGVTPTSTDPAVATAFGVHGNEFGSGVVHIASPGDIAGAKLYGPSLGGLEAEVGVGMLPAEFASRSGTTISAQQARAVLEQMGVSVPGRLPTTASLNSWLGTRTQMTAQQIAAFVRRAAGG